MKSMKCSDLGSECDFEAIGETAEEVKNKMYQHAAEAHKEMLEAMTPKQKQEADRKMDRILGE